MGGHGDDRCARAREWVSLRQDGELSELDGLRLRRHLSRCEGCRAFQASVAAATELVRSTPLERPTRSLAPEPRVVRAPRRARLRVALAASLLAVAAGSGALVGSFLSGDGDGGPGPVRPAPEIAQLPDTGQAPQVTPPRPATTVVEPPGERV